MLRKGILGQWKIVIQEVEVETLERSESKERVLFKNLWVIDVYIVYHKIYMF